MNRNYKLFLKDIEESIRKIEAYTNNISEQHFKEDEKCKML